MAQLKGYKQSREHILKRMESKAITISKAEKPFKKEWLWEKYITEKLDCVKIGIIVHRDPKTIWSWLKYYDIPTRHRGGLTSPNCFKKGQVNLFLGKHHTEETKKRLRQIALKDGRVPYNPKIGSYMKGRKGPLSTNWKGGITPERQSFYQSQEWRNSVKLVWARAEAKCERCGIHHNTSKSRGTFHIHHIISFMVKEQRTNINNLILLCKNCHRYVHSNKNENKELIKEN
jgi:hypothetical protein